MGIDVSEVPQPGEWVEHARCRGRVELVGLFFPTRGDDLSVVAICGPCAVRRECLAYAVKYPALQGIWGGKSHDQRLRMLVGAA